MAPETAPDLATAQLQKELMANHYREARIAQKKGVPLAWLTATFPVEIPLSMGIFCIFPENHTAVCGARRAAVELCQVAESHGYIMDLCSYARCDIGSAISGNSPIGGLPRPDLLMACNNQCNTVTKWYEVLSRLFQRPLILLDAPFLSQPGGPETYKKVYLIQQMQAMIPELEKATGRKFDEDRFRETMALSREATALWRDVLSLGRNKPAPLSCFDAFIHMGSIMVLRGTPHAVDYYRVLKKELEGRVSNGIGAVSEERYRLYWGNIPIWTQLRQLSTTLARYGAVLVAALYPYVWAYQSFTDDPWESLANNYLSIIINQTIQARAESIVDLMREYQLDGFLMHSNRSCKPYTFGQQEIKEMVTARTGAPGLILEADQADTRFYDAERTNAQIEAYMEALRESRRTG